MNVWLQKSEFPIGSTVKFPGGTPLYRVTDHEFYMIDKNKFQLFIGIENINKDSGMTKFSAFPQSLEKVK